MQREMALRGHRTLAVDLPGRGAGFSLAYQTQDLAAFAAEPSPLADVTRVTTKLTQKPGTSGSMSTLCIRWWWRIPAPARVPRVDDERRSPRA
jgi:hypothetical protein